MNDGGDTSSSASCEAKLEETSKSIKTNKPTNYSNEGVLCASIHTQIVVWR